MFASSNLDNIFFQRNPLKLIDWSLIHAVSSDLSLINLIRLFGWVLFIYLYSFITKQPFITNVVNWQGKCAKKTLSGQDVCYRKNKKLLFHFKNSQTSEEEKIKTMFHYVWLWYMIQVSLRIDVCTCPCWKTHWWNYTSQ